MISHLNGGNLVDPPEPVLSRAEWAATFPESVFCPIPKPTEAQARRVALHREQLAVWICDRRKLYMAPFPIFDDEPSQRCAEEDLDTERRCQRARARLMERVGHDL